MQTYRLNYNIINMLRNMLLCEWRWS